MSSPRHALVLRRRRPRESCTRSAARPSRTRSSTFNIGGYTLPEYAPGQALVFLRSFVLGDNSNGTVRGDGAVVDGEDPQLASAHQKGGGRVFYGSAKTEGTWTWPSVTVAAWDVFIATAAGEVQATAAPSPPAATHYTVEL